MAGTKVEELVYKMAEPLAAQLALELVSVEFVKEGANWYLRVYIDKEGGVDVDDCQDMSHLLSPVLDEKDPIPQSYFLEVSSPGIERLLQREKDFIRFKESLVNVSLYAPWEGKKVYQGKLGTVDDAVLTVQSKDGKIIEIPRDKIAQVRLAWQE